MAAKASPRHARPKVGLPVVLLGALGAPVAVIAVLGSTGAAASTPLVAAGSVQPPTLTDSHTRASRSQQRSEVLLGGADRAGAARALAQADVEVRPSAYPKDRPEPPVLPGCTVTKAQAHGYANGRLPDSALCDLPGRSGAALRGDAAIAFASMDVAYTAEFGEPMCVSDSYRSLGSQRSLRATKPSLAAEPGTSEHGWGLAVDLACGVQSYSSPEHEWLEEYAGAYGWYQPDWARNGGSKEEPWHWELEDK